MAELVNTFQRSNSSTLPQSVQPEGTYIRAFNAIDQSREASGFGLTFEEALEKVADFGGSIVGKSYIEERDQTLFFIVDGGSKLVLFDHKDNSITHVVTDTEFGCDWGFSTCEFMYGEFKKFNKCRELHVYFSSNCVYHVVNIDEMLNPVRKAAVNDLDDPCGHFDVFKCICGPHISATPSNFNGSTLEAGSYACAIRLSDTDGNETNVFDVGQFAVASSEDNVGGQPGKSSIKFNISNLDPRYNKAIIYIIKTVAGLTTVEEVDARTYGDKGFTYEYYGQKGRQVAISTLTGKERAYLRGQDQIQKDGFMVFYSLRNEKNLNYQKYANQIGVEYVEWEMSLEQAAKYHFPSLLRGEVYAFAIVWKFCDGTYSPAFHIPAAASAAIAEALEVRTSVSSGGGSGAAGDYKPIELANFDTADQHQRLRNPSEPKDRRNESDKFEDQIETGVDNIDTDRDNAVAAAGCHDNLYGCGGEAEGALEDDIDDVTDAIESNNELLAGFGLDKPDPDVNTTSNLKDSALKLIADAVTNREYVTRKRPTLNYTGVNAGAPGTPPVEPDPEVVLTVNNTRGDNWVDGQGNPLTEEPPRVVSTGAMEVYTSEALYPSNTDCDGQRFFPEGNVTHHRIPWSSDKPHFVSFTNGVENQYQPDNYPYAKTYVRPMGIKLTGIHIPSDTELPKPLCPHSPYKIVYVKRTAQNKSIYAKGYLTGVFEGSNYGVNYAYPRHGVNSQETVDRSIAAGTGGLSRKGSPSTGPRYTFHSPDTDVDQSSIPVSKIRSELHLKGSGWLYGLAEEGKKPVDQWNGTREDYVGARCANNLNHYTAGGATADILGITYAKAHEPTTQAAGITLPLCNTFREGAIYLQASANMAGDAVDQSFIGVVMDHFFPTKCNAPYVALIRELRDQYGSVEGLRYADLGVTARQNQGGEITGICGDTYIGPYSKKRTSYVSNKKGDIFNVPAKPGSPCRERAWCDMPDDKIFEYTGIDYYPTKLPKPGDIYDPKNYAGLHTIAGGCGANGKSKRISEVSAGAESESDFYWPHTLNSLVHTIVECEVNPFLRETGEGDQTIEGRVHYHKLTQKGLVLDARAPVGQPVERAWLNRFRWALEQPSVKQLTAKAWIRSGMTLGGPLLTLLNLQEMEGILGPVMTMFTSGAVNAIWVTMLNTLFTDKRLNELLRIGDCKQDKEGGDLDENIKGFEDNYTRYNRDFTRVNDIYPYTAMPLPYNTCDCSTCLVSDTHVTMADLSRREIKDIKVGEEVVSYDFEAQQYVNKKVLNVWDRGEQEVYRIWLRPGRNYIDATANHKWFVLNKWSGDRLEIVTTQELAELSSKFPTNERHPKYTLVYAKDLPDVGEKFLTEEEGYLLGMYIAEGNHHHANRPDWKHKFSIWQFKVETKTKIREALEKTNFKWTENTRGFYLKDLDGLEELFNDCGRGAQNKRIPDEIFRLDKTVLKAVYEGLIDGDGTRTKAHIDGHGYDIAERESFYTSSKQLEYDLRYLSNLVGRPHSPSGAKNRSGFGSTKPQYITTFSEKGYLNRGKAYIRKIEKLKGVVPTFDIEVEDTQNFILSETGVISHNCGKENINNDAYYSNKQNPDSDIDAYRNVKINNYQNTPCHYGDLKRLFILNNQLMAHYTDGYAVWKINPLQMQNDIVLQQKGDGQLLSEPQLAFEGVQEGFAGTTHPNAGILTPSGYWFVDDKADKIYRLGEGVDEVSAYDFHFFKNHMGFCTAKECYDEKSADGNHYSLGWDPRYNRFLITKYDGQTCDSWTYSFRLGKDAGWISLHSYIPQDYLWTRGDLYSITGSTLWKHHKKGEYLNVYGEAVPFIVDFSAAGGQTFTPAYMEIDVLSERQGVKDLDETFTEIGIQNSNESTGLRPVEAISDNEGSAKSQQIFHDASKVQLKKVRRRWVSNNLHNLLNNCDTAPLTTTECCNPLPEWENGDCEGQSRQDFRGRHIPDDHLIYRLKYQGDGKTRLYLRRVKTVTNNG